MTQQKGFAHAFLIIGLVAALAGALGFIFWQNFVLKGPDTVKSDSSKTQSKENVSKKSDETASNSTFSEEGLTFKYSSDVWDIVTQPDGRKVLESKDKRAILSVSRGDRPAAVPLDPRQRGFDKPEVKVESVTVAGNAGYKYNVDEYDQVEVAFDAGKYRYGMTLTSLERDVSNLTNEHKDSLDLAIKTASVQE